MHEEEEILMWVSEYYDMMCGIMQKSAFFCEPYEYDEYSAG